MNSCRSIEFAACAPPLITFIIGTGSVALVAAEVAEERDALVGRARLRRRRATPPRIAFAPRRPLFGVPSSSISARSSASWSAASRPRSRPGDLAVHVRDRLRDALAAPLRGAVAQLDGLVHAGRRARGDDRAARARRTRARRRPRRSGCRASRGPAGARTSAIVVITAAPLPGRSSASCSSSESAVQSSPFAAASSPALLDAARGTASSPRAARAPGRRSGGARR